MKNLINITILLTFLLVLSACGGGSESDSSKAVNVIVSASTNKPVIGKEFTLTANLVYTNQTSEDITSEVSWGSSDETLATVNDEGVVTPLKQGDITFSATYNDLVGKTTLSIAEKAYVTEISLSGVPAKVSENESYQLSISATMSNDNTAVDQFDLFDISSSNQEILTIDDRGKIEVIDYHDEDIVIQVSSKEDSEIKDNLTLRIEAAVESIDVDSPKFYLEIGAQTNEQISVIATLSNGETKTVTGDVEWYYSLDQVDENFSPIVGDFFIDAAGILTAKKTGTYYAKAKFGEFETAQIVEIIVENPLSLVALQDSTEDVTVAWNAKSDATEYLLYWDNNGNITTESGAAVETINDATRFSLSNIEKQKTYFFRVAYKRDGESEFSELSPELSVIPLRKQWRHKPGIDNLRDGAAIALYKEDLYIFGGRRENENDEIFLSDSTNELDFISNKWSERLAIPAAKSDMAACIHNESVYL